MIISEPHHAIINIICDSLVILKFELSALDFLTCLKYNSLIYLQLQGVVLSMDISSSPISPLQSLPRTPSKTI